MLNIKVTKPRKLYMKECDIILVVNLWVLTTHTHTQMIFAWNTWNEMKMKHRSYRKLYLSPFKHIASCVWLKVNYQMASLFSPAKKVRSALVSWPPCLGVDWLTFNIHVRLNLPELCSSAHLQICLCLVINLLNLICFILTLPQLYGT